MFLPESKSRTIDRGVEHLRYTGSLIMLLFAFSALQAEPNECMVSSDGRFCIGDRVFYGSGESKENSFGVVLSIETLNDWKWIIVRMDDGTVRSERHSYKNVKDLPACIESKKGQLCTGSKVAVFVQKLYDYGIMEIAAILPYSRGIEGKYEFYGNIVTPDGKAVFSSAHSLVDFEGEVPEFPELRFGDSFYNVLGIRETIYFYDHEDNRYVVKNEARPGRLSWYSKEKLQFRYTRQKEAKVEITRKREETLGIFSTDRDAYRLLAWRTMLFLVSECEERFFGPEEVLLKDPEASFTDYESRRVFKTYLDLRHMGGDIFWPLPRKEVTATVRMSATCVYKNQPQIVRE